MSNIKLDSGYEEPAYAVIYEDEAPIEYLYDSSDDDEEEEEETILFPSKEDIGEA